MSRVVQTSAMRGSPLAMLALVMAAWVGGRALTWENPFPSGVLDLPSSALFAESGTNRARKSGETASEGKADWIAGLSGADSNSASAMANAVFVQENLRPVSIDRTAGVSPAVQYGHQMLWLRALGSKMPPSANGADGLLAIEEPRRLAGVTPLSPPFDERPAPNRWSLDAWAFWREGSSATAISQGRVPIYGASQIGANAQLRVDPSSRHDPRLFARAYRALVNNGETELAAGASLRPLAAVPVRVAAELRLTDTRFGSDLRPAAMAITELPVQNLPGSFRLEAYGGAGYVGGKGATAFADGQASVTRHLASFDGPSDARAQLSVGAGAWGGAQRDASRVDVGPTVRLDLTLGDVPARISVDWRERVGGDASPDSGVAATLSTRF